VTDPLTVPAEEDLLLRLERRAVEHAGAVALFSLSTPELCRVESWRKAGFLGWGRMASWTAPEDATHWVELSDEAWRTAHAIRRRRADEALRARRWKKATEVSRG
jgi:hypothetical protein